MIVTLPEAWSKLVADEDELLLELIADKVESLCGFKPDVDAVAKFLRERVALKSGPTPITVANLAPSTRTTPVRTEPKDAHASVSTGTPSSVGYTLDDAFVACRNGREILIRVFEALADRDSTFLERFASRPKHGRTRRYLARSPEELYPGRQDLATEHSIGSRARCEYRRIEGAAAENSDLGQPKNGPTSIHPASPDPTYHNKVYFMQEPIVCM
jgi:hypothetical protein